jgi:DNA-directed RNA polymerase specialized sigma subunit
MARRQTTDSHFRFFAKNLEAAIARYGEVPEGDLIKLQRNQIETLVALEKEFRHALIAHPWGNVTYREFVQFIVEKKGSILAARPFFRERQAVFTAKVSKALQKRHDKGLYQFHFNHDFIAWMLQAKRWRSPGGARIRALAEQIRAVRKALVEMNMPLAISRARIFWSRTPESHLSYMDLVQITGLGLIAGIDKFVLPYSPSFRAMLIGRMVGNLIEQYSETQIHFYPSDKRKIYRANKIINRFGDNPDFEVMAQEINRQADARHRTHGIELAGLMSASSTVSADAPAKADREGDGKDGDAGPTVSLDLFQAAEDTRPDVRFEEKEAMSVMTSAIAELSLKEQKLLRLKGVAL